MIAPNDNISVAVITTSREDSGATQASGGTNLLHRIAAALEKYIYLSHREDYTLLAAWVIGTHLYKSFDYFGYVLVDSPDRECGKTELLKVLNRLVWQPSGLLYSPTEATMFRLNKKTQLLDEGDGWQNVRSLRNILNAGFQADATVARCEGQGNYKVISYDVYIPRVLAGIALTRQLHDTILSRSFRIVMARQTAKERRKKFRLRETELELKQLHTDIVAWASKERATVEGAYDTAPSPLLAKIDNDRTRDVAGPLFAIVGVLSPGDLFLLLRAVQRTRGEEGENIPDHFFIIDALYRLGDDPVVGMASELAQRLHIDGVLDSGQERISSALRTFEFRTKTVRLNGDGGRKRYSLPRAELAGLLERYGYGSAVAGEDHEAGTPTQTTTAQPTEIEGG